MKPRLHVAYTKHGKPTGRVMAKLLGADSYGTKPPLETPDVLVRWGSRRVMEHRDLVINNITPINAASNKVQTLAILRDHGLPIPIYFLTWDDMLQYVRYNWGHAVVLGRDQYGSQGRDIEVYKVGGREADGFAEKPRRHHDWYSIFEDSRREYRLHVVKDKVVRVQGKYLDHPEQAEKNPYVRNYSTGYRFRTPRKNLIPSRKKIAIQAVQTLGLDFGAVDMILNGERATILEVNTAPSCSPLTAHCYAGAIGMLIEERSHGEWECAEEILAIEVPDMPDD